MSLYFLFRFDRKELLKNAQINCFAVVVEYLTSMYNYRPSNRIKIDNEVQQKFPSKEVHYEYEDIVVLSEESD